MAIRLPFCRSISFTSFSLLKLMWLRKSMPSERIWPFCDELAAVAHCFPALPTRREERALIHNLESKPKSDKRDCFENKKTDKQEFAELQEGKPHQMPGTGSNAQSLIQLWEAQSWRHCLAFTTTPWGHRVLKLKDTHSYLEDTTQISDSRPLHPVCLYLSQIWRTVACLWCCNTRHSPLASQVTLLTISRGMVVKSLVWIQLQPSIHLLGGSWSTAFQTCDAWLTLRSLQALKDGSLKPFHSQERLHTWLLHLLYPKYPFCQSASAEVFSLAN